MNSTRFQILCRDGVWRFVFCRSLNSTDRHTGSALIPTEARARAYLSYGDTQPEKDLAYFTEHANGAAVRTEQPIP
jgi:hypothetical protein